MSEKIIDCTGLACPAPVINTKKALEEGGFENLLIIVDNEAAKENVTRFAGRAGCSVAVEEKDGSYHLKIKPAGGQPAAGSLEMSIFGISGQLKFKMISSNFSARYLHIIQFKPLFFRMSKNSEFFSHP